MPLPGSGEALLMGVVRWLARKFWLLIVSLVIVLAITVQTGRLLSPQVENYRPQISHWLSNRMGVPVQMERISLRWEALEVALQLDGLRLGSNGELRMGRGLFQLDLLATLWNRELVWKDLQIHTFAAGLSRDKQGEWRLDGFPGVSLKSGGDLTAGPSAADPARIFQLSPKIQIRDAAITVQLPDSQLAEINLPQIQLEHRGDFRRLIARAFISREGEHKRIDSETLRLVLEGRGNPREKRHFSLRGYLQLNELLIDDDIVTLLHELTPLPDRFHWRGRKWADGRLWLQKDADNGYRLLGRVDLAQVENLEKALGTKQGTATDTDRIMAPLRAFSGDISGRWLPGELWQLTLQDIQIEWQNLQMPPLNLQVSSDRHGLALAADVIELGGWREIVKRLELLDGVADDWLRALEPSGQLHRVQLLQNAEGGGIRLIANLRDISTRAFQGAPAVSDLSGYLELNGADGRVELDGTALGVDFPTLYAKAFSFERASGTVAWAVEKEANEVSVLSGPLQLDSALGEVKGQFLLTLPFQAQSRATDFVLALSLRDAPASAQKLLVPKTVSGDLRSWLNKGLGTNNPGRVESAAFIYRGSSYSKQGKSDALRALGAHNKRQTVQLVADFADGSLKYADDWPSARDVEGRLLVNDGTLLVNANRATLWDIDASDILVGVTPLPGKGSQLNVKAQLSGPAADGLRLLQESPLRQQLGSAFDDWQMRGDIQGGISLSQSLGGGALSPSQRVELRLHNGELLLQDLRLHARALHGDIVYDSGNGLAGTRLDGKLWGRPIAAHIRHFGEGNLRDTQIVVDGSATAESITAWGRRPELHWLDGVLDYQALVTIPAKEKGAPYAAIFELTSNLAGVAVNLPQPLGKAAQSETNFVLRAPIGTQGSLFHLDYGEHLQGQFWLVEGVLDRAAIALNAGAKLPAQRGLAITGDISSIDLPRWQKQLDVYFKEGDAPSSLTGEVSKNCISDQSPECADHDGGSIVKTAPTSLPVSLDLSTDRLQLGAVDIEHIHITGQSVGTKWQLDFDSEMAAGNIAGVLDEEVPLRLQLAHLRLPAPKQGEELSNNAPSLHLFLEQREDPWADFDFESLPAIDFSTENLQLGDEALGRWSFRVRPSSDRLVLSDIRGAVRGFRLEGRGTGEARLGAQLMWMRDVEGNSTSQFIGRLVADDLADIQRSMGHQPLIESKSASFDTALRWDGSPVQVKGSLLSGALKIDIRDGRFLRSTGTAGSTVLRLLSLFNFDTWARRLRLDFSDLYKSGMAFDRVRGEVVFEGDGQLLIAVPIQVEGPTSELQMAGRVNLLREDLDLTLVATLPVGNNLALVAALAGNLPAAAGVYLISKAFKKQVNKMASVSYRISGDWAEPQIRYDRLFDGDGAKREGVISVQQQNPPPEEQAGTGGR
ncbi:YhdP family protein [Microbulbifer sp. 2205BS26-8]|uniref:YhdP family protein n=1 Tax=Microbulbifer sp. 2205BS26-8 TaxID=3064386 RepID=UPI00273E3048|nr:YhdP family protein [Microbulbifer sp. 2205BS26-8]MDP5209481.1 YhdP family protein [Microbulbifer sp. 2205BS26-8]